jgi:general secretion pathway protein G
MVRLIPSRHPGQPFTTLERVTILIVIGVFVFIALCFFRNARLKEVLSAREAVLREDCRVIRSAVSSYTADLQKAPTSFDDVVQAGYLKMIPRDFSQEACKW